MNPLRLTTSLEIKSLSAMQFEGHGSVFGNEDMGGDVVLPEAFSRSLARHKSEGTWPAMLWMHDMARIAGKWMEIFEDETGLAMKGELAPTDLGKEIHALLKMDAVRGLSIGYVPKEVDYTRDGVRLLKDVELLEVSIVAIPMNPKAQIAHVKSRLSVNGEYVPREDEVALLKRDCEQFLRGKGLSKKMARQYASNLFKSAGETPELDDTAGQTPAGNRDSDGRTPQEIEVVAGLAGFRDRQLTYDLEKRFKRIFR
jgi:HK97 family phage prohead protease